MLFGDLVDEGGNFLSYNAFVRNLKVKTIYLEYFKILSLPSGLEKILAFRLKVALPMPLLRTVSPIQKSVKKCIDI